MKIDNANNNNKQQHEIHEIESRYQVTILIDGRHILVDFDRM